MGEKFWDKAMIKRAIASSMEYVSRLNRQARPSAKPDIQQHITTLKKRGYIVLDHMIGSEKFNTVKNSINHKFEQSFDLEFPCLAQAFIDNERDQDLVAKNFLATKEQLEARKLTFDRQDIASYQQMINELNPSTLTIPMPSVRDYYELWLDPVVTEIISNYMGFVPELTEAYTRRNFPCNYRVMNHNWHRDTNHKNHLLKAFIFFTDCDVNTGAHHYIAGSAQDPRFRDKVYFTDDEINSTWPIGSEDHIVSTVPAGTIIIEDTRGLHKAGIPMKNYRDLGFAVFLPPNHFKKSPQFYQIEKTTYDSLSDEQQRFIPSANVKVSH